jgi:hypothetical protein
MCRNDLHPAPVPLPRERLLMSRSASLDGRQHEPNRSVRFSQEAHARFRLQ